MKEIIKAILFPNRCPYCSVVIGRNDYACDNCKKQFPEFVIKRYASGGVECCSAFSYSSIFSNAIKRLKFSNMASSARLLAIPLVQCIIEVYDTSTIDIITCVPMHKKMKRKRRYNQAELLARECAKIIGIEYADALEKHKQNRAQHTVKASERESNVKGVFRVKDPQLIRDKRILIVDDVITTGHTMGECAAVLIRHGCKSVCGATVCSA